MQGLDFISYYLGVKALILRHLFIYGLYLLVTVPSHTLKKFFETYALGEVADKLVVNRRNLLSLDAVVNDGQPVAIIALFSRKELRDGNEHQFVRKSHQNYFLHFFEIRLVNCALKVCVERLDFAA